jgi:hypothetical protein
MALGALLKQREYIGAAKCIHTVYVSRHNPNLMDYYSTMQWTG